MEGTPIKCHDCKVRPGEMHMHGCDGEQCARCGGQSIGCNCVYEVCGIDTIDMETEHPEIWKNGPGEEMYAKWDAEWGERRIPWSGFFAGVMECRELGFWCVENPVTRRFTGCSVDTHRATEDLTRLHTTCDWDRENQRFVLPNRLMN